MVRATAGRDRKDHLAVVVVLVPNPECKKVGQLVRE
jgi:hypothetical protein